jgi:hypothetical protein
VLEAGALIALLHSRIDLVFQEILPSTYVYQGADRLGLLQKVLFRYIEETRFAQKKPSMFEA